MDSFNRILIFEMFKFQRFVKIINDEIEPSKLSFVYVQFDNLLI